MMVSLPTSSSPSRQLPPVSPAPRAYSSNACFLKLTDYPQLRGTSFGFSLVCKKQLDAKRRIFSGHPALSNNLGIWEDPDDGSDSEDEVEDEEEVEENDLDFESDWEGQSDSSAIRSISATTKLPTSKYDEDLVREVEQLLDPEERRILQQNENPNMDKLSTAKWNLFHTFALAGQLHFMDRLLDDGVHVDIVDKDIMTALHRAVVGKKEAVISHLLRKGASPHVRDLEGWTPLHVAMQSRNRDIAKILLVNGADKTRRNKHGKTPLDLSLCYGKDFKSYDLSKLLKLVPANRFL